ncbi:MAG TPA: hypothetical protein VLN47_02045 [Clostridiaceae bacterium]|nr:hypothetical protein [Clostridiaceae bacterium]
MKNRRYLVLTIIIVFLAAGVLYMKDRQKIYGNDESSIKMLLEKELGMTKKIEVFGLVDIGEYRLAGYSMNDMEFSFAEFRKNEKGDYEPVKLENMTMIRARQVFVSYHDQVREDQNRFTSYLVILNNNPNLREVTFTQVTGQRQAFSNISMDESPAIHVFEIPNVSPLELEYKFYDGAGNPIGM